MSSYYYYADHKGKVKMKKMKLLPSKSSQPSTENKLLQITIIKRVLRDREDMPTAYSIAYLYLKRMMVEGTWIVSWRKFNFEPIM